MKHDQAAPQPKKSGPPPLPTSRPNEGGSKIEGEGSYEATRRYDQGVERSVKEGRSEELAEEAKKALEGPEGASLREADRIGKSGEPKKS